ncbi:hypothetical protein [Tunicatimonas pelagia]|uniref:hypothetical protein n=1 Tax=Tunicatimonas pelagia TaxID=931531 RepID=UPI0026651BFF|nr:hypothetical protein [Tunicatimonas pelagia]WKN44488.1 hypothetical protein P0M28_05860 [Tunicatimonas pelagia]
MERKLDQALVKQYSEEFTEKVLSVAYATSERLSGKAILNLTPVKQINLLVIKALFDQWQHEIDKLRSPYFDYESEEVQQALDDFINTLSQHISVDQSHLQPLVEQAVQETLYLVLSPNVYYQQQVATISAEGIREEDVLTWLKYIKINRPLLELYINKFRQQPTAVLDTDAATHLLDETVNEFSDPLEDASPYVASFSEIYSFEPEQLMADNEPSHSEEESVRTPEEDEHEEAVVPTDPRTLHDYLSEQSSANTTLTDIQKKHKIGSIREYIGVNQRYMFIRELFGNDPQEYQQAIYELDQKQSYVEAFNFLRHEFAQKHHWKMDSEEVVELLEIVSKRYN